MIIHKKKLLKPVLIAIALVLFAMIIAISILYFKYVDKEHNIVLYTNEGHTQEVYILGTIHEYHFEPLLNYSYLDLQNVIDNTKPDLLLLEVDQDTYNEYGVVKSPVEIEYWNTVAPEKAIAVTAEESEGRNYWVNRYQKLVVSLLEIKENILIPNALYK